MKKHNYKSTEHWDSILRTEFESESDRAAVILTASLLDNALYSLLKNHFVPLPSNTDSLFDSANSPLSTFSAKIDISHRIGLISSKFCRDLHLIRRIRNEFAHNIHGCTFENSTVKQRILELAKSSKIIENEPRVRKTFEKGTRGDFLMISSWMLWSLNSTIEDVECIKECFDEFGYRNLKKKNEEKKDEIKALKTGDESKAR